ncbi:MAG: tyrosine-type recombinase/integrase [Pseudomonadota bacterium]|nr:tyrosine-type recombinase/integrase [Pseudomonadota bacterium]
MTNSASLGPWVRRFLLEHLVAERNLAVNTQKSYRDMLTLLLPFAVRAIRKPIDRLTVDDLSPQIVRLFLTHMEQQRNCTISTRNQRLGSIRALARFIAEHNPEYIDWCAQIRLIPFKKSSQPAITYLVKPEMDALLAAPDDQTVQGHREYVLLLFLYNSGARVSEAAQLRIGDVDWHAQCVRIVGKGGKQRRCPLWSSTLQQLRDLTGTRGASESMFLNRCHQPMTRSGIHALVKRCATKACARVPSLRSKKVSPHVIRHSTASHLLHAGVDINTIRGWLGHVSINTTNIYAETDLETKARALATCAVADKTAVIKHWRNQPRLMEFLRTL